MSTNRAIAAVAAVAAAFGTAVAPAWSWVPLSTSTLVRAPRATAPIVQAATVLSGRTGSEFAGARRATTPFTDVGNAVAAGYAELRDVKKVACIAMPGRGGMGIHYVNSKLAGDAVLDLRRPEALVYEPRGAGLRLVALEYIVFQKAWKKAEPPAMFGRTFDYVGKGNRYGLPPFWALHAWVWKPNPAGDLMAWNPRVSCT